MADIGPSYVECSFLIPIHGDVALSDGSLHAVDRWNWLKTRLRVSFGGGTQAPGFHAGFWTDPDTQQVVMDESRRLYVALTRDRVEELRDVLREACIMFHQKCIYLSIAGEVEFIERPNA